MNVEFKLPELGENIQSGDVVRVMVREGDVIAGNDGVIELETDKAVVEIPCPHAGKVVKVYVSKGQTIKVGQPVLSVEVASAVAEEPQPAAEPMKQTKPQVASVSEKSQPPPPASPAGPEARRVARELGIDLARVEGTGKGGRITVEDVRAAVAAIRVIQIRADYSGIAVDCDRSAATVAGVGIIAPIEHPGVFVECCRADGRAENEGNAF